MFWGDSGNAFFLLERTRNHHSFFARNCIVVQFLAPTTGNLLGQFRITETSSAYGWAKSQPRDRASLLRFWAVKSLSFLRSIVLNKTEMDLTLFKGHFSHHLFTSLYILQVHHFHCSQHFSGSSGSPKHFLPLVRLSLSSRLMLFFSCFLSN